MDPRAADTTRVLICAPIGRDAALTRELLASGGIAADVCGSVSAVCTALGGGAAALILTEEVLECDGFDDIVQTLRRQPPWSDTAVLLFTGSEGEGRAARRLSLLERLPSVTLLERPVSVAVALSVVRSAIRARQRQLDVRDLLLALHDSREQAETANRLKDEFLATLSHELRTPLNAILGWAAMLRRGQLEPSGTQRGLEVIDRNANALAQLVDEVLDMARVITGKLRIELQPVMLRSVLDACVDGVRPGADAKKILLETSWDTEPPLIRADPDRLQQVFWNLLSNAIKFTPEGGRITVRVTQPGGSLVIAVRDTGIGLEREFLPYVFDRFRQADQTVTRSHGGLGLGLSIVKHLVELHGGRVSAESDGAGLGCTFTVTLPLPAAGPLRAGPDSTPPTTGTELRGRNVLVVDGQASTRNLLQHVIEDAGGRATVVESAAAALAQVPAETPDLLISDVALPGEDGLSLMRRIRALPGDVARVPSLALSAYTRAEDRQAALAAGFTEFLPKPSSPADVLRALDRLLATARSRA